MNVSTDMSASVADVVYLDLDAGLKEIEIELPDRGIKAKEILSLEKDSLLNVYAEEGRVRFDQIQDEFL